MRSTIFSKEKIVLRIRSAENFPFRGKFSEVYIHLKSSFVYLNIDLNENLKMDKSFRRIKVKKIPLSILRYRKSPI